MIICFDCSRKTKELMDSFLELGDYRDYGEVIASAIENLHVIRSSVTSGKSLTSGSKAKQDRVNWPHLGPEIDERFEMVETLPRSSTINKHAISSQLKVPEIFRLPPRSQETPQLMELPADDWVQGQPVPVSSWLFAMYNRLLPVKANCRALRTLIQSSGVTDLKTAIKEISESALELGNYLANWDRRLGLNRDSALATAFPVSTRDLDKGLNRYSSQFVGSISKHGRFTGILIALKFINFKRIGKETVIGFTEPGWRFACMPNPVLDAKETSADNRFSEGEIEFFLNHISTNVPIEDYAYRTILKLIQDHINSPEDIDERLQGEMIDEERKNFSKLFLTSQRSGAVSRMSDLNLLNRKRNGVTITYEISPRGLDYLEAHESKYKQGRNQND